MNSTNCSIVISSFDGYSDAWRPFFELFWRYWPDCPYPIYLIANNLAWPDERVRTIKIPNDQGWGGNFIQAIKEIKADYIIYLQEDYFLKSKVNSGYIESILKFTADEGAVCMRLFPCPGPDLPYKGNSEIGAISKDAPYRISLQAAIWESNSFLELIRPEWSGWDMEIRGTIESSKKNQLFLGMKREAPLALDYFCTAILKGKWLPGAIELCEKEGVEIDLSRRPVLSAFDKIKGGFLGNIAKPYFFLRKMWQGC